MNETRKTNLTPYDCFVVFKTVVLSLSVFSIPVWALAGYFVVDDICYYEDINEFVAIGVIVLLFFLGLAAGIAGLVLEFRASAWQRNIRIISNVCFAANVIHLLLPFIGVAAWLAYMML